MSASNGIQIRLISDTDHAWIGRVAAKFWASTHVVSRGIVHDLLDLPGYIAMIDNQPTGLICYNLESTQCELVALFSIRERIGIGRALVEQLIDTAANNNCQRIWLVTTNDNLNAIRFYQRRGFTLVAVHRKALDISRKLKPSLPIVGIDGIPLRDEIEMELLLNS
jgi:GNAT superfamily N-acetyltransferase